MTRPGARLRLLTSDARGNVAVRLALIIPGLILLGAGVLDLFAVHNAHNHLQRIAEAGALAAAPGLATDADAARTRAATSVADAMRDWPNAPTLEDAYEIVRHGGEPAIRIRLRGHRPSLLGNMLPPGGWTFSGEATATSQGLVPTDQNQAPG
ncbi:hypothetical protein [Brevundimonas sp. Root1423]|uniref:TadE/TadG family type IV pilus assembly protein n=1 Tax=Brevundimonas sp. Root1423 TaxID=1736462 RepID=UPI0006F99308